MSFFVPQQCSGLLNGLGTLLLILTFVAAAAAAAAALASTRGRGQAIHPGLLDLSRRLVLVALGAAGAACLVLLHLILIHDFSNEYVAGYTDRKMALLYLATAVWGGQAGSLLFWGLCILGAGYLAIHWHARRGWAGEPWAIFFLMVIFLFFGSCLIFVANPFQRFLVLGFLPDGDGLNPLLQNPAMVYHPPAILAGYAIWAIPVAYALAGLVVGDVEVGWQRSLRGWTVSGWLLLSLGNLFGAFWAYTELGWGGFWGWDPVENASLMPWFTATAYIHSVMVQERRRSARVWNQSLLFVTFFLTLLGTFITRTGIIQSVHAFGSGSVLGVMFMVFMVFIVLLWLGLMIYRRRELRRPGTSFSLLSQEGVFLLFNVVMVLITLVVLWGTVVPTIYQALAGAKITIGAEWFNKWVTPLGVVIILLVGLCPLLPWRRATPGGLLRAAWLPLAITLALTALEHLLLGRFTSWYIGGPDASVTLSVLSLLALLFANLALVTILQETVRGTRVRRRREGSSLGKALVGMVLQERRRFGGYLVHVSMALLIVAIAGQAYKMERDEVALHKGGQVQFGPYLLTYEGLAQRSEGNRTITEALVTVRREGAVIANLRPGQHLFAHQRRQVTTEVDTHETLLEDLFVALVGYDPRTEEAVFNLIVNPLIIWLWLGTLVLVVGSLLALLPRRRGSAVNPPAARTEEASCSPA